jgi:hypothetical protein
MRPNRMHQNTRGEVLQRQGGKWDDSGQAHAEAQLWRCELKNVAVAPDAGILAFGTERGDEGSHRGTRQRDVAYSLVTTICLFAGNSGGGPRASQLS